MKNITVTVDDCLYHRARVRAAEKQTTISALVRAFLAHLVEEEPVSARLQRRQNEILASVREGRSGYSAAERLSRDQAHDRDALR